MIIAIAAEHANSQKPTGVEHYTRQLILALSRVDKKNQYILYTRTKPQEWLCSLPTNFTLRYLPSRFAWTQVRLSAAILIDKPHTLLVPSFSMPLIHPRNTIVTIHDLAWLLFPETETTLQRWSLTLTHIFAKLFARRLIAVSHSTKRDLVTVLNVHESLVDVVHHGVSEYEQSDQIETTLSTYVEPHIVCLGTLQPRKNLSRLIEAFSQMKQTTGLPHVLVIAGREGWMCDETLSKIKQAKDVMYVGYVADRLSLLRGASLLVLPSIYEGFGLSLLDAFSECVPVACSNISSLPEVAGDAAEFFDPYDISSISNAMSKVLQDDYRAADLVRLGSDRLKQFSWDNCAKKTLDIILNI
jgi:glycosyltransferase involved in cell wall biosynthesis